MFEKWRIKNRISITMLPAIQEYEKDCPIYNVEEKVIESKRKAIEHGIEHILWYLFPYTTHCDYCDTEIRYWKEKPDIHLCLRKIILYKNVPPGAKDLRIVTLKGWLAHITYSAIEKNCPKCGLVVTLKKGGWGLNEPLYGFSTTDYLIDTESGYARVAPTVDADRWEHLSQ